MTGPQHYLEAERLASAYKDAITAAEALPADTAAQADDRHFAASNARALLEKAQVHATLALVAAQTDHAVPGQLLRAEAWDAVTS